MDQARSERLRTARILRGFRTAAAAADAFGWNRNTYASNESGNARFSYRMAKAYAAAFGVQCAWLYDAAEPMEAPALDATVPLVGRVGDAPDGAVTIFERTDSLVKVPRPAGGAAGASALHVEGPFLGGLADTGAIVYFQPTEFGLEHELFGSVVVAETTSGRWFVGRLARGANEGYDLWALAGPAHIGLHLAGAMEIITIIPPLQARRLLTSAEGVEPISQAQQSEDGQRRDGADPAQLHGRASSPSSPRADPT